MPHIHTEPGQHDHTASAYVVRTDFDVPKIVLHRHRKLGKLLQFGGHIELDQNPWEAIADELKDESGYDLMNLDVLQPPYRVKELPSVLLHPVPLVYLTHDFDDSSGHKHTDVAFGLVASSAPDKSVADGESDEIHYLSIEQLQALSRDDIYDNVRTISVFVLEVAMPSWERVPASDFSL